MSQDGDFKPDEPSYERDLSKIPSSYQSHVSPELQPPPPSYEKPVLEQISPDALTPITDDTKEDNDTNEDTSGPSHESPYGQIPASDMFDENWKPNKIMRRADWGAAKPRWIEGLEVPISKVVLSFTETDPCYTEEECRKFVQNLQKEHMEDKNEPDIKHNFLIGGDDVIYEGRGYRRVGPKYKPSPKKIEDLVGKSIDIGIIERSASKVPKSVITAVSYCVALGMKENYITKDFYTYYNIHGEIEYVQGPNNQEKVTNGVESS